MNLQINNNCYKILFVKPKDKRLEIEENDYRNGMTDFVKKEIYINKKLKWNSLKYTIMHELTHAYLDSYGFLQVDFTDEIVADIFGNYFINIFNDYNKILMYYYNKR